jgi:hypothetical protein
MSYRIMHTNFGENRDTQFIATVRMFQIINGEMCGIGYEINMIDVIVAKLADKKWWIIPNTADDEPNFEDIGPFDDVETAIVHLKLSAKQMA